MFCDMNLREAGNSSFSTEMEKDPSFADVENPFGIPDASKRTITPGVGRLSLSNTTPLTVIRG